MTRVFSGVQPSGEDLHLGNYLGAFVNWVAMQDRADCVYCVVDLHAITEGHDPDSLRRRTLELAAGFMAVGVDPSRSTLFVQSHLPEHAECAWLLDCVAGVGELGRMPQYREKSARAEARGDQVSAGLLTYPVLQTADILLYDTDEVPVGDDQRHHIELARDIGQRFNHRFGEVFRLPKAIHPAAAARVMDLQDPSQKMSKSVGTERGLINLLDTPDVVAKKVRSAVTDSGSEVAHDRATKPGISNLLEILSVATGRSVEALVDDFARQGYGTFKSAVAEAVVEMLRPVQQRHREISDDPAEVARVLADGAHRAREIAGPTLARARQAMGLLPAG